MPGSGAGDVFEARPEELRETANAIQKKADDFKMDYEKIYQVLDSLIGSEWSSPAAVEIYNKIAGERKNLEDMFKAISSYSQFCMTAANRVEETEQGIIDGVGGGYRG